MINACVRDYDYYLYGEQDGYGQAQLSKEAVGTIKLAVFQLNKTVQNNIQYTDEEYIGFTYDKDINDSYVIQYGDERLKVLYTISAPRHKTQVFMKRM